MERELASDDRDQALIEKVKRMYAAQGLEVSDEIIAAGVKALKENRFTYQPPPRGSAWLANLYVTAQPGEMGGHTGGLMPGCFFLYQFAFVAPEIRRRQKEAKNVNTIISQQQDQVNVFKTAARKSEAGFGSAEEDSSTCRGCRQTTWRRLGRNSAELRPGWKHWKTGAAAHSNR